MRRPFIDLSQSIRHHSLRIRVCIESLAIVGDIMHRWLKCFPSFVFVFLFFCWYHNFFRSVYLNTNIVKYMILKSRIKSRWNMFVPYSMLFMPSPIQCTNKNDLIFLCGFGFESSKLFHLKCAIDFGCYVVFWSVFVSTQFVRIRFSRQTQWHNLQHF